MEMKEEGIEFDITYLGRKNFNSWSNIMFFSNKITKYCTICAPIDAFDFKLLVYLKKKIYFGENVSFLANMRTY